MLDDRLRSLLEEPTPAVLTTYRRDGSAATSPVWFRFNDDAFEVVVAAGDVKLKHLARRPACALVVFEAVPPFRGIRVEAEPELVAGDVAEVRLAIASRYLGSERGRRFTDQRDPRGTVLRFPVAAASSWDLSAILPD
jgi:hypothetical protein